MLLELQQDTMLACFRIPEQHQACLSLEYSTSDCVHEACNVKPMSNTPARGAAVLQLCQGSGFFIFASTLESPNYWNFKRYLQGVQLSGGSVEGQAPLPLRPRSWLTAPPQAVHRSFAFLLPCQSSQR